MQPVPDIERDLQALGLPLPAAASWLGVDLSTLYRWLRGERPTPRAAWLAVTLARRLGGVPPDTMPTKEK